MSSLERYLQGTRLELIARAEYLLTLIPRQVDRELLVLEQICRSKLSEALQALRGNAHSHAGEPVSVRLRALHRIVRSLEALETVAVVALNRAGEADAWLNELLERITHELNYPLLQPVVSALSRDRDYYHIYPEFKLLCVPLSEGAFLLHLPDLYHELAHLLLDVREDDPRIRPFQRELLAAVDQVEAHFAVEKHHREMARAPTPIIYYYELWPRCWGRFWMVEFFCDLFALYTAGPAYAWAHYHLVGKHGSDLFAVPRVTQQLYPADAARMRALLEGLHLIGFSEEAAQIETRWAELVAAIGAAPTTEFSQCYPSTLLAGIAEHALSGTRAMDCRVAGPGSMGAVTATLNEAWGEFWRAPGEYGSWETKALETLRAG